MTLIMPCTSYGSGDILALTDWAVHIALEFEPELRALPDAVKEELSAQMEFLRRFGPTLGRPRVDTLKRLAAREHERTAVFG
jgi:hypothetical protein